MINSILIIYAYILFTKYYNEYSTVIQINYTFYQKERLYLLFAKSASTLEHSAQLLVNTKIIYDRLLIK
jgi:hypothetical protein